jgi:hypothetical protein
VVSILDRGNADIVIHPQEFTTDTFGNPRWTPSETGVQIRAMVWPVATDEAATLSRETGEVYRVRPVRGEPVPVGPWATVEWDGREWDVHGEAVPHARGAATRRTTFTIRARVKKAGDGSG